MKTLYFECNMGAAGDMIMSALLELHPHPDSFMERLNGLGIPNVTFKKSTSVKCGISGTHVEVAVGGTVENEHMHEHGHHHEHEHHHEHGHSHEHHQEHARYIGRTYRQRKDIEEQARKSIEYRKEYISQRRCEICSEFSFKY